MRPLSGNLDGVSRKKTVMDTTARQIAKSLSWQLLGLASVTCIGWFFTGSLVASGGIAISGAATGLVLFVLHEKVWAQISWGRRMFAARLDHRDVKGPGGPE